MNELHCHKKVVTYLTKILKWLWYDTITKSTIYKQNFIQAWMFYRTDGVLKRFLKISQISLENTCAE